MTEAAQTLHQRILDEIEGRIVSGEWPPGHRIPFEMDLAAHYGCSRMTVNKALTQLARAGLIERRKKSGSFVTQPRGQSAVLEIADIKTEILALGLPYACDTRRRAVRRGRAADGFAPPLPPGARVLEIACVHIAGPRPFCLEERAINLAAVPEAEAADFSETPPGLWLLRQVPWSAAEHRIRAVAANAAEAEALGLAPGAACLEITRTTACGERPVTRVRLLYPGDRHTLAARFTPTG